MKLDALHSHHIVLRSAIGTAGHLCIWPAVEPYPMIYRFVFGPAALSACQAWVAEHAADEPVFPKAELRDPLDGLAEQLAPLFDYGAEQIERGLQAAQAVTNAESGALHSATARTEIDRLSAEFQRLRVAVEGTLGGPARVFTGRPGKWSDSFLEHGTDAMVLGGSIAAAGALGTPLVPDGEVVGGALVLAGAASYGIGKLLHYANL